MIRRVGQYIIIAAVIGAFYYLLSHHFIITSWRDFDVLKKTELTLAQTFYSIQQASPAQTLEIKALRDAGIGDWMVEQGMITVEEYDRILRKLDAE